MVAWTANIWLVELVLQSSTSMTEPGDMLPPRTAMQRFVLVTLAKNVPFCALAEIDQICFVLPLQAAMTTPVPLVPAPASRHFAELPIGEIVQLLPLGAITNTEVESFADWFHC